MSPIVVKPAGGCRYCDYKGLCPHCGGSGLTAVSGDAIEDVIIDPCEWCDATGSCPMCGTLREGSNLTDRKPNETT